MIEIVFWVLVILRVVLGPYWPNAPWPSWSANIIDVLLFICIGLAIFGFGLRPVVMR
jgi:hypothetical protein